MADRTCIDSMNHLAGVSRWLFFFFFIVPRMLAPIMNFSLSRLRCKFNGLLRVEFWKDTTTTIATFSFFFFAPPGNTRNLNLNLESLFRVQFQLPDLMQLRKRANNKVANSLASGSRRFNDLWLWFLEEDRYLYLRI